MRWGSMRSRTTQTQKKKSKKTQGKRKQWECWMVLICAGKTVELMRCHDMEGIRRGNCFGVLRREEKRREETHEMESAAE